MKRQIGIIALIIACTLLASGCGSRPSGSGQTDPAQVAPPVAAVATAAVSNDSSVPTDASPVPHDPTAAVQADVATVPVDEAPTVDVANADVATAAPIESSTADAAQPTAPQPPDSGQPQDTGGDATDAIFRAIQARGAATSYREKLTTPEDAPGTSEVIEVINPDRSHEVATEAGNITRELIGIGADIYSKNGQEAWVKLPSRSADAQAKIDSLKLEYGSIEAFRKRISDAHDAGTEELGGTATKTYQYVEKQTSVTRSMTVTISTVNKLWVGAEDGLPRKSSIDSTTEYSGRSMNTKVSIFFYDYNADIKIEAPIP